MMTIFYFICFLYVMYHRFSQKIQISDLLSFISQFFEAVKGLHKVLFPILVYTNIVKYTIPVTYKQRTLNSRAITGVGRSWWDRL